MTAHRKMLVEAMARAMAGPDEPGFWESYVGDAEAALDALATGPVFEEMVKQGADALDGGAYSERLGIAKFVLRAALGAGQPPPDQNENERP